MFLPALMATLTVPAALAWNSEDGDNYGPSATTVLWTSEHRDIYASALASRGLADTAAEVVMFTDGTADATATVTDWSRVAGQSARVYSPAMFADLPDFAFSVGGWAGGNAVCPLDGGWSSWQCYGKYGFGVGAPPSWLVAGLNSSHFVPQAQHAWAWYHQLALDDAARCSTMKASFDALAGADEARTEAVERCEMEAIAFEGVAQHYLQDAWSSGHMWQRWGSSDIADWGTTGADMARAVLVGAFSGLIHGSDEMPLCMPGADVQYVSPSGSLVPAAGDKAYATLSTISAAQFGALGSCVTGSLDDVLSELPGALGAVSGGTTFPGASECFAQRVTNGAMRTTPGFGGAAPSVKVRFVARLLASKLTAEFTGSEAEYATVSFAVRRDVVRNMVAMIASSSTTYNPPDGTNLAEGVWYDSRGRSWELTVGGMRPNGAYTAPIAAADGLSTYDPAVSVISGGTAAVAAQETTAAQLRYGLYEAHPDYWCGQSPDEALLAAKAACQDESLSAEARDANCGVCGGIGQWLRRDGRSAAEPGDSDAVCDAFGAAGDRVYLGNWLAPGAEEASDVTDAWCAHGCASTLQVTAVNAADANVDGDAELTPYYERLTGLVQWYTAMGSYYYSIYQWSLGDYYMAESQALGYELIEIARLLGAVRNPSDSYARWNGGGQSNDSYATMSTLVGVSDHAVSATPSGLSWDGDLAELPNHSFAFTLENGESYPVVLAGDAKVVVDSATGAPQLRLRNLIFVVTPYIDAAAAVVEIDGTVVARLDNLVTSTTEATISLDPATSHRLTLDISGMVRDTSDLYAPDYDTAIVFRAFALDFSVSTGDSDCGLP